MTTGAFWNVTDPLRPWGYFDPSAVLDIPFDWADWLREDLLAIESFTITPQAPFEEVSSDEVGGVVTVVLRLTPDAAYDPSGKYGVTCRIVTTTGLEDERTVFLKVRQR